MNRLRNGFTYRYQDTLIARDFVSSCFLQLQKQLTVVVRLVAEILLWRQSHVRSGRKVSILDGLLNSRSSCTILRVHIRGAHSGIRSAQRHLNRSYVRPHYIFREFSYLLLTFSISELQCSIHLPPVLRRLSFFSS